MEQGYGGTWPVSFSVGSLGDFFESSADVKGAPLDKSIFEKMYHTHIVAPGEIPGGFVVAPAGHARGYDADGNHVPEASVIYYGSYVADEKTLAHWVEAGKIQGVEEIIDDNAKTLNVEEAEIFIVGNDAMAKASRLNEQARREYEQQSQQGQYAGVVEWRVSSFRDQFHDLRNDNVQAGAVRTTGLNKPSV